MNTCFFDLSIREGRPKYFFGWVSYIAPKISLTSFLVSSSVFWLKKIKDFSVFILWPTTSSYFWRMVWSSLLSCPEALQYITLSSVKSRWVMDGLPLHIDILENLLFLAASTIKPVKPSAQRRKRYGDRGSPWRKPLVRIILPWITPLIRIG